MTNTDTNTATATTTATSPTAALDVVHGIYGAFGQGDIAGLLALLDPDIDWSTDVTAPGGELVPMFRHGRGHGAALHYFGGAAQLEFHVFEPHAFHADGDIVIVEVRLDCTHRTTAKRAQFDELHHWVVRDGRAVRYRPFVDTASMIELFRP
jgi:ketosteroid isomerase-like protein